MTSLRPYQETALAAILGELESRRSTLAVLPTGTGKTVLFARAAEELRSHGRVLVLAHRGELLTQAEDKIRAWTSLRVGIERAEHRAQGNEDVIVASVQTLCRPKRLERFDPSAFGLVIVDEAHHAVADSYRRILDHFSGAKVLGVTATADRFDGLGLGRVFESIAYAHDLRTAIGDGWLVPIKAKRVEVDGVDLRRVRKVAGDFVESDLEAQFLDAGAIAGVVRPTIELAGDRQTIVFAVTVAHAQALADAIDAVRPGSAQWLSGASSADDRRETILAYARGEFQFLVGCMLFTEGFDCPPVSCVTMARPTKSRALYTQMVGRGTRLHPGKEDLLVLDMVGNVRHGLSVTALDLLADSAEVAARAASNSDGAAEPADVLAELDRANEELRREAARRAEVRYRAETVDPMAAAERPTETRPPSDAQRAMLERHGFPTDVDRATASRYISEIIRRTQTKLCTPKQSRVLQKYGLSGDLPFAKAREVLDAIAANGWRLPASIAADRSLRPERVA